MAGEWAWALIIGFLISCASAVWVNGDAEALGIESPYRGLWTVIAFFFPILGLLLYVTVGRKQASDLLESAIDQPPKTKICKFCERSLAADAIWCDACGRAQE
jgi:hypothetical protein